MRADWAPHSQETQNGVLLKARSTPRPRQPSRTSKRAPLCLASLESRKLRLSGGADCPGEQTLGWEKQKGIGYGRQWDERLAKGHGLAGRYSSPFGLD